MISYVSEINSRIKELMNDIGKIEHEIYLFKLENKNFSEMDGDLKCLNSKLENAQKNLTINKIVRENCFYEK